LGLGDLHPPDRLRTIAPLAQVTLQLAQQAIHPVLLHRRQGLTIDPGGAPLALHAHPRLPEDVTPPDPVEQSVEAPTRRPLGGHP
jgi:hypothetical protein